MSSITLCEQVEVSLLRNLANDLREQSCGGTTGQLSCNVSAPSQVKSFMVHKSNERVQLADACSGGQGSLLSTDTKRATSAYHDQNRALP